MLQEIVLKTVVIVIIFFGIYLIGAIAHEADLSRNFKECGDAKAWIFKIKR